MWFREVVYTCIYNVHICSYALIIYLVKFVTVLEYTHPPILHSPIPPFSILPFSDKVGQSITKMSPSDGRGDGKGGLKQGERKEERRRSSGTSRYLSCVC